MSVEAISLALAAKVSRSSAKFVLVALANCANSDMTCWPSIQYLCDATSQDRKTVIENLRRLKDDGHIADTGKRQGQTGQVVVYLLVFSQTIPKAEPLKPVDNFTGNENSPENGTINSPESGTVKTETVPFFPLNSPVFPCKESRFSVETVPKTGHGTVNEPSTTKSTSKPKPSAQKFDPGKIALPDSVSRTTWERWISYRRQRKLTTTQATMEAQAAKLAKWAADGYAPEKIIETSIENGWQGLFEPKAGQAAKPAPKPENFATKDYGESRAL